MSGMCMLGKDPGCLGLGEHQVLEQVKATFLKEDERLKYMYIHIQGGGKDGIACMLDVLHVKKIFKD